MENFEYNRSFSTESEETESFDSDERECMKDLINKYEDYLKNNPRFVLSFAPALFEKTVADCERVAKEFSGKIKVKVDYSFYTATIDLWCCYVEFEIGEFMNVLHRICHHALSIRFTPLTTGELHIEIMMPYFVSAKALKGSD